MKINKGFTLVEILVSISIITIILISSISFVTYISKETKETKDKAIAIIKANQILSEIRDYVDSNKEQINLKYLDNFNDPSPNPFLSIENVGDPSNAPSDNIRVGNNFKYARQIVVYPIPNAPNSDNIRVVEVRMYKFNNNRWQYLTSATTVINTLANFLPPTQAYDIYFLSIGTIPGWWVHTPAIREIVDSIISDLEARNPSLDIVPHWITVMSYGGRDPYYRPFIGVRNANTGGVPISTNFVYYYIGTSYINNDSSLPFRYYTNSLMMGNIWYSDDQGNTNIKQNVYPFSLADQYNHCVRYPKELENYQKLVYYAKQNNLPIPEISYRMLIEKLYSDPSYRNSIIINLHGELMPVLPARNESDPAKLPYVDTNIYSYYNQSSDKYSSIRVAVHPENIAYPDTGIPSVEDITLRVYAYQLNPNSNILPNDRLEYITLRVGPLNNASYSINLKAIDGGISGNYQLTINQDGSVSISETQFDPNPNQAVMKARVKMVLKDNKYFMYILLQNTPTKCPLMNGRGLPPSKRLYGLEYIPFMFPLNNYRDLLTYSNNLPKNTARWIITIKDVEKTQNVENPLKIVYTIDPPTSNGKPHIYSFPPEVGGFDFPDYAQETYTWVCRNLNEIPITEQFQLVGDPRLCPYKDVVQNMRYNSYFAYPNGTDLNLIKSEYFNNNPSYIISDSWNMSSYIPINVPGEFFVIREALAKSHSIFNSITGFSFYYVALGQEIGGDAANNLPNGVPVRREVFGGSGVINGEQSITHFGGTSEAGMGIKNIVRNQNWGGVVRPVAWGNYSIPFMGEIFPDDMYLYWRNNGNLPTGQFMKKRWSDSISTPFGNYRSVRTAPEGCASFFNASPSPNANQWFNHGWGNSSSLSASKQILGNDLEDAFNITLPNQITSARPWQINLSFQGQPPEWNTIFYRNNRFINSIYGIYYNHSGANGANIASGIVRSVKQTSNESYYWAVINGLSPQGAEAQSFIARYSITTSLYAFLLAGFDTGVPSPAAQLPLISITSPTNTQEISENTIVINWQVDFKRWDGNNYILNQPNIPQNTSDWHYLVKIRPINSNNWYFIQDTSMSLPTNLGEKPPSNGYFINTNSYEANISNLPNGMYWLLVEAHNKFRKNHFSYHIIFVKINK